MTSYWQILRPQAGQNLITQPSFEIDMNAYGITPWTAVNSTMTRSTVWQFRGAYSLRIAPTSNTTAGVYYTTGTMTGTAYTFSVYGQFASGVPYQVRFANTSGVTVGTAATFTGTGTTQRVSVTATLSAAVHRIYIQKNNSASTAGFNIDAAQLELGSVATTYIDGDQPGCIWNGIAEFATSTRSADSTAGGVWLDFEDDLGIIPLEMQGVGMPPIDNIATPYALLPGARFERALARSRVFTIVCLVPGSTWANMHVLREALIARVQPDQTTQQQPVYLRYTGASEPQIIAAHYDGGLEFAQPSGFAETVPLRFVAHDPYWYSEREYGALLTDATKIDVTSGGAVLNTATGVWQDLTAALNGEIYAVLEEPGGTLILGGNFTDAGGVAAADYIVRYNPTTNTYTAIGTFNGAVRGLAYWDDYIVAVGDFTTIDAATARRIAYYDPFAPGWAELGNANASVTSVIRTAGYIVVAGTFTTIDGTARTRIARYDINAVAWGSIGTGLNGTCNALTAVSASSDAFYAGGAFTTAAGTTVNRVAYYNGTAFVAMGTTGVNNTVNAMALTSEGQLYVGGAFTSAGGITANYIALWTGTGWQALPSGPRSAVTALSIAPSGVLLAAADSGFTPFYDPNNPAQITAIALFQSNTWIQPYHSRIDCNSVTTVYQNKYGYLIFGVTGIGAGIVYGVDITVNNVGTAPAQPIMSPGGGGVYQFTTQQGVWFLWSAGGNIIADTRAGQQRVITYSTRTPATQQLLPGSQLSTFQLMPGNNIVAAYATPQTYGMTAIYWRARNWSLDV